MESKIKVSSKSQIERLVKLMEENPQQARGIGQFGCSRQEMAATWVNFATELNALGPPIRSGVEWQRVWVHYKANLKRKLAKNKESLSATGGGPLQELSLSPTEERVLELTHVGMSINPVGRALGVLDLAEEDSGDFELLDGIPSTSNATTPLSRRTAPREKAAAPDKVRVYLLAKQLARQAQVVEILERMEKTQYKGYLLQKRKLELAEKSHEEKSELRQVQLAGAKLQLQQLQKM